MTVFGPITFVVGCAAVTEDLARRRISNWTSGGALAAGFVWHASQQGWRGLATAAAGTALGFGIFLVFYVRNGMGGGDVKLMAGFGSLLGPYAIFCAAWMAAVAGGLMAVGYMAVRNVRTRRRIEPGTGRANRAEMIPYAPAIVAGVWLAELALG